VLTDPDKGRRTQERTFEFAEEEKEITVKRRK